MSSPRALLLFGVLNRAVSPALARALAPPAAAVGMALVWMLQALPLDLLRGAAARQGPLEAAATLSALAVFQSQLMRHPARAAWRQPAVELLDRQPLPWTAWTMALVPMALSLSSLTAFVALLWPWASPLAGAWLVLGLSAPLVFSQLRPDGRRWGWALGLGLAGGALIALARRFPGAEAAIALPGGLVGMALIGPARLAGARRIADEERAPARRPRGPLAALVTRDLLALWRLDRGLVLGCAAGLALPWPLMRGLWRNGGLEGEGLEAAALILMALASPLLAMLMSQLGERLGRGLDVPEWPVSVRSRALSLALIPAIWGISATFALVAAAPEPLLPWGAARLLGLGAALAGLAATLIAWSAPPIVNMGVWCLSASLVTALLVLTGRVGLALGPLLGATGLWCAALRLRRARESRT